MKIMREFHRIRVLFTALSSNSVKRTQISDYNPFLWLCVSDLWCERPQCALDAQDEHDAHDARGERDVRMYSRRPL